MCFCNTCLDENNKIALESYHKKFLNTEFSWNKNSLPEAVTSQLHASLGMARVLTRKIKNKKISRQSGLVSRW